MIRAFKKYFTSDDFLVLKEIAILFAGWRIIISLIGFFGLSFLPQVIAPGQTGWAGAGADYWIKWANWDGGHFRGIAENGYIPFQVVFFPLYPMLIRGLMIINIHSLWGGLIISSLAIVGALFYLYKLTALDYEERIAKKVIYLTLAFPTAFYFGAVYSEALFLFLTVGAFYYARKKAWIIALLFASFSAVTRLTGLAVILAVAIEYFLMTSKPPFIKEFWGNFLNRIGCYMAGIGVGFIIAEEVLLNNRLYILAGLSRSTANFLIMFGLFLISFFVIKFIIKNFDFRKLISVPAFFIGVSFLPFIIYCTFLSMSQDNFLAFVDHEQLWHRHLTTPWTSPITYFKSLVEVGIFQLGGRAQTLIEFLFFVMFSVLLVFSYFKLRISYTVFFAICLILPLSTGTLTAIHRYGLIIFPIFILLALIKNETYLQIWMYFSLTMLGFLTVLYINSYWVS
jgi:hypothetical protein